MIDMQWEVCMDLGRGDNVMTDNSSGSSSRIYHVTGLKGPGHQSLDQSPSESEIVPDFMPALVCQYVQNVLLLFHLAVLRSTVLYGIISYQQHSCNIACFTSFSLGNRFYSGIWRPWNTLKNFWEISFKTLRMVRWGFQYYKDSENIASL